MARNSELDIRDNMFEFMTRITRIMDLEDERSALYLLKHIFIERWHDDPFKHVPWEYVAKTLDANADEQRIRVYRTFEDMNDPEYMERIYNEMNWKEINEEN
jgi:hypothetical protein